MICTPEEARSMICCSNPEKLCQADGCMAWRKETYTVPQGSRFLGWMPSPRNRSVEAGKGFCGLAYK